MKQMKQTEFELLRWKYHNENKMSMNDCNWQSSWHTYWKEIGAFISILPRQVGKSTMIAEMAKNFKSAVIISPMYSDKKEFEHISKWTNEDKLAVAHNFHLFMDEFSYIQKSDLDMILNNPWKSVTMVSSLK